MISIQYYSHILLHSKYSFIIKLAICLSIYLLFYADNLNDLAYCAKKKGAAKAAEAAKTAASAKAVNTTQLVAEAKTNAIKATTSKYLHIIKEKNTIIQHKEKALQHTEVALQNSYRRFFAERDKVRDLETLVAEIKEGVDLDNFYSLKEANRKLNMQVESLTDELRRERDRVSSLREEIAKLKTKKILKARHESKEPYEDFLR